MIKITAELTDRDVANTHSIRNATSARSNAHALSISLSLTQFLIRRIQNGDQLLLRNSSGTFDRVVMPELENVRQNARS
jgi:hypothetical protein